MSNIFSSKSHFVQQNVVCPAPVVPAVPTFWTPGPLPSDQHLFDCFEFQWSRPTTLIHKVLLFSSYFTTILDGRMAGRAAGEINTKANSAQLSWDLS